MNRLQETYQHYLSLREELSRWLRHSLQVDGPSRHGGGEDEANYSLAWFPHQLITGDECIQERFQSLLADLSNWVETEGLHGYEPVAEAHHGTEPFLLFLPRYQGMFPHDELAAKLIEDAAHHIGNWVEEIPAWYDYEKDTFFGYQIGTRVVSDEPRFAFELAEHFRFIHIALAAHRVTGEDRYLDWSLRYGRKRAERLLAAGDQPLPLIWGRDGNGLYEKDLKSREQQSMSANSHHEKGNVLAGVENLLASGAVNALGDLFLLSGDEIFRDAALKIVEPLVDELLDPYVDPGAAALSYYRWTFQDDSLDARMREIVSRMPVECEEPLAMVFPQEYKIRGGGVGKRADMIRWGHWSEDGSVVPTQEPSTATHALAYQLTGEVSHACRAFKAASTRLMMARRVLRGGREHADMGGAICSVAAGHGRNWGQGAVTGCYGSLVLGTREIQSKVVPLLEVQDNEGKCRLPEEILSLVSPDKDMLLYNGGEEKARFKWRWQGEEDWRQEEITPGDQTRVSVNE